MYDLIWRRARKPLCVLSIVLFSGVAMTPVEAADFSDPEWPCIQRKVLRLSVGQMWAGPEIGEKDTHGWREVEDVAALVPVLAVRRTSEADAAALIEAFASEAGEQKDEKLKLLFAGAFTLIDRERSEIIGGIGRYARTQTALSTSIEESQNALTELNKAAEPDWDKIEELEDKVFWDSRIYKDRAQSLTYVCESPVILERRAFALARAIMNELE